MLPFAYQLTVYSYGETIDTKTLPTLRPVVGHMTAKYPPSDTRYGRLAIAVLYPDGSEPQRLDIKAFVAEVPLDEEALLIEARALIAKDAAAQAEWMKTIKGTVTGSPWLCDMGEEAVVEGLIEERGLRWAREDEVDWAAIEASLVRGDSP